MPTLPTTWALLLAGISPYPPQLLRVEVLKLRGRQGRGATYRNPN